MIARVLSALLIAALLTAEKHEPHTHADKSKPLPVKPRVCPPQVACILTAGGGES